MNRRDFIKTMAAALIFAAIPKSVKATEKYLSEKGKQFNKKLRCAWNMGTNCQGRVRNEKLFGQILIPICDAHLEEHRKVMSLYASGEDIEKILKMSAEERNKLVRKKKLDWHGAEL